MQKTQFTVDMGSLPLTDEQIGRIDVAIKKAVAAEIAHFNFKEKISITPMDNKTSGRSIGGVRDIILGYWIGFVNQMGANQM